MNIQEQKAQRGKPTQKTKISLTPYHALITAKSYTNAFNILFNQSDKAFLAILNKDFWKNIKLLKSGEISNQQGNWTYSLNELPIEYQAIDITLLQAIYSIWHDLDSKGNDLTNGLTIHVSELSKKTGINLRGKLVNNFIDKLKEFDNVIGVINNDGYYRYFKLLTWQGYDEQTGLMKFHSEFICILREQLENVNKIEKKDRYKQAIEIIKPYHDYLVHSNITSERNKYAVELVFKLVILLRQANSPENTHISFKNLMANTTFEQQYNETANRDRPKVLKRAFSKFYELLKTKTDLYDYYIDLNIPKMIPTPTTLSAVLNITYKEQNKNFCQK